MRISDWSSDVCSSDLTEAYNDGYYFESDNNIRQKAFSFLNASVTWTAPDDRLSVSFWGRNILDKAVPGQVSSVPSPSGGGIQADYTNPPATYGATARFTFAAHQGSWQAAPKRVGVTNC